MISNRRFATLLAFQLIGANAAAELTIKRDVITDCPAALNATGQLSPDERTDFLEYLRKVLVLESPQVAEALSGSARVFPGNSPFELNVFNSLQPTRDLEAKRCAIQLLTTFGSQSFVALPELMKLLADARWTDDFRGQLSEVSHKISIATANDPTFTPADDTIQTLIAHLDDGARFYAARSLIELGSRSIPSLMKAIKKSEPQQREELFSVLALLDPGFEAVQPTLANLLQSADDDLRNRILDALQSGKNLTHETLTALLKVSETSLIPTQVRMFTLLMERAKQNKSQFDTESLAHIVNLFQTASVDARPAAEQLLIALAPLPPEIMQKLYTLAKDGSHPATVSALRVLLSCAEIHGQFLDLALENLFSNEVERQVISIESLARSPSTSFSRIDTALARLLKSLKASRDRSVREKLVQASLLALGNRHENKTSIRWFLPYALEALTSSTLTPEQENALTQIFLRLGTDSTSSLIKTLRSADTASRMRALHILVAFPTYSSSMVEAFLAGLNEVDAAINQDAKTALLRLGDRTVPVIEDNFEKLNNSGKLNAAEVLFQKNAPGQQLAKYLVDLPKDLNAAETIRAAKLFSVSQEVEQERFVDALFSLRRKNPDVMVSALKNLNRIPQSKQGLLSDFIADETEPFSARLAFLSELSGNIISDETAAEYAAMLFERAPAPARERVLELIVGLHVANPKLISQLQNAVGESEDNPGFQYKAVVALGKLAPATFDVVGFFVEEFKKERRVRVQHFLPQLPSDTASTIIVAALDTFEGKKKTPVLEAALGLREISSGAKERFEHVLKADERENRFLASYLLFRLNPNNASYIETFRYFLVEPEQQRIRVQTFPFKNESMLMLRGLNEQPRSRFEQAVIARLLTEISKNSSADVASLQEPEERHSADTLKEKDALMDATPPK